MANLGVFGGVTLDPDLLAQFGHQDILTFNGMSAPRMMAHLLGMIIPTISAGLTISSGTTQNANPLPSDINEYTTVAAGTAVTLPFNPLAGKSIVLINAGANALLVFPFSGGSINALATNASFSLAAGTGTEFAFIGGGTTRYRSG